MTSHSVDGIEIYFWPNPIGLSAFAPPLVFDLEWSAEGLGTIDAFSVGLVDFPLGLDRYRILSAPDLARLHQFALAHRDRFQPKKGWEGYLVKHREPGIDEAEFLAIVVRCMQAFRRRN